MDINLRQGIAALRYYREPLLKEDGKTPVQFEELNPERQKPYLEEADEFLVILDKLNVTAVPDKELEESKSKIEMSDAEGIKKIMRIIKHFVAGLNTRQDVHSGMINWDVLARAIWNGEDPKNGV